MNKFSTLIALVFVLGCVSAIDWNATATKWGAQPQLVVNSSDTNLTSRPLTLYYATNTIVVLAANDNKTSTERNVSVKGLTYKNESETLIGTDGASANSVPALNARLYADSVVTDGVPQMNLYIGSLAGAAQTVPLSKNTDKTLTLSVLQVFAHQSRYYVVYSNGNGTVTVASVGTAGDKLQTVSLTDNSTTIPKVSCAGLSGKDNLYCLWTAKAANTTNKTENLTYEILAEATINPVVSSTVPPFGSDYFQGKNYNTTSINTVLAYNAGKQYGGLVKVDNTYSTKNANTNKTVDVPSVATPAGYNAPILVNAYAHLEQLALLWTFTQNNQASPVVNLLTAVQYIEKDGSSSSNSTLFTDVTQATYVQYSNGALYTIGANTTHAYLGQVWGDTGLSASLLQTAFAAVLAIAAAIVLI